jgi:hypothetical protein
LDYHANADERVKEKRATEHAGLDLGPHCERLDCNDKRHHEHCEHEQEKMHCWCNFDPGDARPLRTFQVTNEGKVEDNNNLDKGLKMLELNSSSAWVVGEIGVEATFDEVDGEEWHQHGNDDTCHI